MHLGQTVSKWTRVGVGRSPVLAGVFFGLDGKVEGTLITVPVVNVPKSCKTTKEKKIFYYLLG